MPLAVNRSKPVVLADEGADFSGAIRLMAKSLLAAEKKAAAEAALAAHPRASRRVGDRHEPPRPHQERKRQRAAA